MSQEELQRYQAGLSAFSQAKRQAFFQKIISHIRGTPTELFSFDDIRARLRLHVENYRGLQDVPLDQIVGSVGRYHEFTRHFLPKRTIKEERWSNVYAQTIGDHGLPPVELYKVDDVYFVRDGNHRVSVARQLGAKTIQAEVIELPTPIGFRPDLTPEEIDATTCYAEFLNEARPLFPYLQPGTFRLSHPTAYNDLLGHINLYQCVEACAKAREIALTEAAAEWFERVYVPVIETIRAYGIMQTLFPNCTETDLYLWVTEHLSECEQELMDKVQPEPLNDFLVGFLQERNIPIPQEAVRRLG
jgi:hypothetical protein